MSTLQTTTRPVTSRPDPISDKSIALRTDSPLLCLPPLSSRGMRRSGTDLPSNLSFVIQKRWSSGRGSGRQAVAMQQVAAGCYQAVLRPPVAVARPEGLRSGLGARPLLPLLPLSRQARLPQERPPEQAGPANQAQRSPCSDLNREYVFKWSRKI